MFRGQMINFLQTVVVFLLITNALSILVAWHAMSLLRGRDPVDSMRKTMPSWLARGVGIDRKGTGK